MARRSDSARISPTAHYTGYVWTRHRLSVPELETAQGRLMYGLLRPADALLRATGRANLEDTLLTRHRAIDGELVSALDDGKISQVVEIAAGLSPRGLRLARRYSECRYVEADLDDMADQKRRRLGRLVSRPANLEVRVVDALAATGPGSLSEIASELDPSQGTAVVTEGLLNYFDTDTVVRIWSNIAAFLRGFPYGIYLSDLHLEREARGVPGVPLFIRVLSAFARGAVHLPFPGPQEAQAALLASGFDSAAVPLAGDSATIAGLASAPKSAYVRIVRAEVVCKSAEIR